MHVAHSPLGVANICSYDKKASKQQAACMLFPVIYPQERPPLCMEMAKAREQASSFRAARAIVARRTRLFIRPEIFDGRKGPLRTKNIAVASRKSPFASNLVAHKRIARNGSASRDKYRDSRHPRNPSKTEMSGIVVRSVSLRVGIALNSRDRSERLGSS